MTLSERHVFLVVAGTFSAVVCAPAAYGCTAADTSKGILTAAYIASKNEKVTGEIDATGCDIGVLIQRGVKNVTVSAEVHDADQYGVFTNGNAAVDGSEIYNIGHHTGGVFDPNGSQTGVGVYFFDASGSVSGSDVHHYQKGGVVINGRSMANVTDNTVTGEDPVTYIAQNGIQFGYGARGNVMRNIVSSNWYTGANWSSTGILLFETGNVTVQDNAVQNSQNGVAIEAWCWFEPSADNNQVVNNQIVGSDFGVSVGAVSFPGYSQCDASADNNKVTNNIIDSTASPGTEGVSVWAYQGDPSFAATADNNKAIHNTISGFTMEIADGGSSTKVHANVID